MRASWIGIYYLRRSSDGVVGRYRDRPPPELAARMRVSGLVAQLLLARGLVELPLKGHDIVPHIFVRDLD